MAKAKKAAKRKAAKDKGGRPSTYSAAKVEAICARLSKGEPLTVICRDEGMPHDNTVRDWMEARPDVSVAIARAREAGHDHMAAECMAIADDARNDFMLKVKTEEGEPDVVAGINHEHIQRSKLRIDTRLKLLAKWDPKRYGDKVQLADAEGNKLPPAPGFVVAPIAVIDKPE